MGFIKHTLVIQTDFHFLTHKAVRMLNETKGVVASFKVCHLFLNDISVKPFCACHFAIEKAVSVNSFFSIHVIFAIFLS